MDAINNQEKKKEIMEDIKKRSLILAKLFNNLSKLFFRLAQSIAEEDNENEINLNNEDSLIGINSTNEDKANPNIEKENMKNIPKDKSDRKRIKNKLSDSFSSESREGESEDENQENQNVFSSSNQRNNQGRSSRKKEHQLSLEEDKCDTNFINQLFTGFISKERDKNAYLGNKRKLEKEDGENIIFQEALTKKIKAEIKEETFTIKGKSEKGYIALINYGRVTLILGGFNSENLASENVNLIKSSIENADPSEIQTDYQVQQIFEQMKKQIVKSNKDLLGNPMLNSVHYESSNESFDNSWKNMLYRAGVFDIFPAKGRHSISREEEILKRNQRKEKERKLQEEKEKELNEYEKTHFVKKEGNKIILHNGS